MGLAVASMLVASAVTAQVDISITGGVIKSTRLFTDSIVERVDLVSGLAPTAAIALSGRLDDRVSLEGRIRWANISVESETPGTRTKVTDVAMWSPSVGLRYSLYRHVDLRGYIGVMFYTASDTPGTPFQDGAPAKPMAGVGATLGKRIGSLIWSLEIDWDVHGFSTTAFTNQGFTGQQTVNRFAVGINVARARE